MDIVFPAHCVNCGGRAEKKSVMCAKCVRSICLNKTLFCGRCRARLPEGRKICHRDVPFLMGAATDYGDDPVKALIHGLKFRFLKRAGEILGRVLIEYTDSVAELRELITERAEETLVIPIPLSKKRLRERGFNQSEIIAQVFADRYRLDLATDCLARTRDTKPQSETENAGERLTNVRGCFLVEQDKLLNCKKTVILVDDVITSGATILAAAEELKHAGAKRIIALIAAKV